jgi:glyoxylase-like metal-dependent hydrolase (beta-lactamase superfamily II)
MKIGAFEVHSVIDAEMRRTLDTLYPEVPADERFRARKWADTPNGDLIMSIGCYLVFAADRLILVDTGVGPDPTGSFKGGVLRSSLRTHGVHPEDITDVLFTHLHADHIGWATQDGKPFFPNAVYRCDRRDWVHFMSPAYEIPVWERASTHPEHDAARVRLAPLENRMVFWEGDDQILDGLRAIDAAGHTPGTTALLLESEGERGVILGDIVHSVPELLYGWRFPVHHDWTAALAAIARLRTFLADEHLPCTASHLYGMAWGQIDTTENGYTWQRLDLVARRKEKTA